MQKVLFVQTQEPSVRSDIIAWGFEDANLAAQEISRRNDWDVPVGLLNNWDTFSGVRPTNFKTVLHCLADGWNLLSAPTEVKIQGTVKAFDWILVK